MSEERATNPRKMVGVVVSNKGDKTIVVKIERRVRHRLYGKVMTLSSKMHAHDANNQCQIGDQVAIQECRPISKRKTWTLLEVLSA